MGLGLAPAALRGGGGAFRSAQAGETPGSAPTASRGFLERAFAFSALAMLVLFYVALPSLKLAGQPLRAVLAVGLLLLLAAIYTEIAARALRKFLPLIVLAAGLAVLGTFVSLVNDNPTEIIVKDLKEVHFQAVVTLLVAAILAEICGARASVLAIVGVIGLSALVAFLQMVDVNAAWDLRRALGPMPQKDAGEIVVFERSMGLSYSPIQLSTQICLAFAAFAAVRDKMRPTNTADPTILVALAVFMAAAVATATRSPILGGVIFLGVYFALRRGSWVPLAIMVGGALLYLAWPLILGVIETNAARVLRTDDKSASARFMFAYYGTRLFLDNPLGYGFAFEPSQYWNRYWSDLYMMQAAARGAREHAALHNYLLSMINIYGIGLLLFVPLAVKLLRRAGPALIFFVPYAVHIMFHNSGPLFSDTIIWFVIAAIAAAPALRPAAVEAPAFAGAVPRKLQPAPRIQGVSRFNRGSLRRSPQVTGRFG